MIGLHELGRQWHPYPWVHPLCKHAQQVHGARRVLQEIHDTFPRQLSQHSEQTHGNMTWLAIAKGRMQDVMRLLDQAMACGWTPRPALLSVSGSSSACRAALQSVLACPRVLRNAGCGGLAYAKVQVC